MSQDEHIAKMAKQLQSIKTWWPVIGVMGVAIGIIISATQLYDNKIAKKEDIAPLATEIHALSRQVYELNMNVENHNRNNNQRIDSIVAHPNAQAARRYYPRRQTFVTEHVSKPGSRPTLQPYVSNSP